MTSRDGLDHEEHLPKQPLKVGLVHKRHLPKKEGVCKIKVFNTGSGWTPIIFSEEQSTGFGIRRQAAREIRVWSNLDSLARWLKDNFDCVSFIVESEIECIQE